MESIIIVIADNGRFICSLCFSSEFVSVYFCLFFSIYQRITSMFKEKYMKNNFIVQIDDRQKDNLDL